MNPNYQRLLRRVLAATVRGSVSRATRSAPWRVPLTLLGAYASVSSVLAQTPASPAPSDTLGEIVVSARRSEETALRVPESITALSDKTLVALDIHSFEDYAQRVPNLSFSFGTGTLGYGGSRTIAIRGISGAGTTGFYIDDTPIPAVLDPQVVDLARIEVLKGPQGTLFGEGSLGGNVQLVTNKPSFAGSDIRFEAQAGRTDGGGSYQGRATVISNFVPIEDTLALRVVAFGDHEPGFITETFPSPDFPGQTGVARNQGATLTFGGSVTGLIQLSDAVTVTARVLAQQSETSGLPVAYAPLPLFEPSSYTYSREAEIPQSANNWFYLPSVTLSYKASSWAFTSTTSYFESQVYTLEDGTEGTTYVLQNFYGVPASVGADGMAWPQRQGNRSFNEEDRFNFDAGYGLSGIVGARYARTSAPGHNVNILPGLEASGLWPNNVDWTSYWNSVNRNSALFGELYYKIDNFEFTLGGRKYWLDQKASNYADGFLNGGLTNDSGLHTSASGFNPRYAVSYKLGDSGLIYGSASKGFRPGVANETVGSTCDPGLAQLGLSRGELAQSRPDTLWSYELGAKKRVSDVTFTGAVFQMDWKGIQQTLSLPVCFIPVTVNAGAARSRGAEFEVSGRILPYTDLLVGLGYNNARITGAGISGQLVGSRIYQVPDFTGSVALTFERPVTTSLNVYGSLDYSYTGDSVDGTELAGPQAPVRAGYGVFNGRAGLRFDRIVVGIFGQNLTNKVANLGDINPISLVRRDTDGNPIPTVALLPPRTVGLEVKYGF